MLTFYPEFEYSIGDVTEVVIMLDVSNSMAGAALTEAKKVALLTLSLLPDHHLFNIVRFGSGKERR